MSSSWWDFRPFFSCSCSLFTFSICCCTLVFMNSVFLLLVFSNSDMASRDFSNLSQCCCACRLTSEIKVLKRISNLLFHWASISHCLPSKKVSISFFKGLYKLWSTYCINSLCFSCTSLDTDWSGSVLISFSAFCSHSSIEDCMVHSHFVYALSSELYAVISRVFLKLNTNFSFNSVSQRSEILTENDFKLRSPNFSPDWETIFCLPVLWQIMSTKWCLRNWAVWL